MLSRKVKKINIDGDVTEEYLMPHTKNILNIFATPDLTSLDINASYKENIIKSHIMGGNYGYINIYYLILILNESKTSSVSFEYYKNNNYFKELNKIFKSTIIM